MSNELFNISDGEEFTVHASQDAPKNVSVVGDDALVDRKPIESPLNSRRAAPVRIMGPARVVVTDAKPKARTTKKGKK